MPHPSPPVAPLSGDGPGAPQGSPRATVKGRWWVVAGFALVMGGAWMSGAGEYLDAEVLRRHHAMLAEWVESHSVAAAGLFILAYYVTVTFSIPGALWLTLGGGLLFGTLAASAYAVTGATAGATTVFLLARYVFRDAWEARTGPALKRMEGGFQRNAFNYLLMLRLVPAFPFWLVNLVPAFLGVRLQTYVLATFIGIIPGSLVYSSVGNGLGEVFAQGEEVDLSILWAPQVSGPLIGLGVLALVPVAWSRWRGHGGGAKRDRDV